MRGGTNASAAKVDRLNQVSFHSSMNLLTSQSVFSFPMGIDDMYDENKSGSLLLLRKLDIKNEAMNSKDCTKFNPHSECKLNGKNRMSNEGYDDNFFDISQSKRNSVFSI